MINNPPENIRPPQDADQPIQPVSPSGRFEKAKNLIKNSTSRIRDRLFGRQQDTQKIQQVQEELLLLGEKSEAETNIGVRLIKSLEEKGITLPQTEADVGNSVLADGMTNETVDKKLLEKLQKQKEAPNGYLIGIGAGNVFTMLDAFPKGSEPKAILLFDINSKVIAYGQQLIDGFRESAGYGKVLNKDLGMNFLPISRLALEKHGQLLHRLAQEGNLVIARANFMDSRLTEELAHLPNIHDANNVVYLSNIADPIYEISRGFDYSYAPSFQHLEAITPRSPHTNYFADTVRFPLEYDVRFRREIPEFSPEDFSQQYNTSTEFGVNRFRSRPLDEIEHVVTENPALENLNGWDIQRIIDTYHSFRTIPEVAERVRNMVDHISAIRKETIGRKEEFIRRSKEPPTVNSGIWMYIAPTEAVIADLQNDYDYDRDFIPYVATTYWQDASFPNQIDLRQLPHRKSIIKDPATGKWVITEDMTNFMKGKIEEGEIGRLQGLSFEEMSMAKLYRETKNRVLVRDPHAVVAEKSLDELVKILLR